MKQLKNKLFTIILISIGLNFSVSASNIAVTMLPINNVAYQYQTQCQNSLIFYANFNVENISNKDSVLVESMLFFNGWNNSVTIIDSIFIFQDSIKLAQERCINGQAELVINKYLKNKKNFKVYIKTNSTGVGYLEYCNMRLFSPIDSFGNKDVVYFSSSTNNVYVIVDCKQELIPVKVKIKNYDALSGMEILLKDTFCHNPEKKIVSSIDYNFSGNILYIRWFINDSFVSINDNYNTYYFTKPGINKVKVIFRSTMGEYGMDSFSVFSYQKPPFLFQLDTSVFCKDKPIGFQIKNKNYLSSILLNGFNSITTNKGFLYSGGETKITISWNSGCKTDTSIYLTEIQNPEKPSISSYNCIISTNSSEKQYKWYYNNKLLTNSDTNTIISKNAGLYYCEVSNGSCSSKSDLISVYCGTAGIDNQQEFKLSVYPNPATDQVSIKTEQGEDFKIFDMIGQEIISGTTNGEIPINVESIPSGTYNVITRSGTTKFIKQ